MLAWITDNLGAIFVGLLLLLIVSFIVFRMVKNMKNGKDSCGGNCGCCPMGGSCHK